MRPLIASFLVLLCAVAFTRGGAADGTPVRAVPDVDLDRYAGRWYEIARFPNRFQKRCAGDVSATYRVLAAGRLEVVNECRRADGRVSRAKGAARLADMDGPSSKLEVRFAPAWLSWLPFVWGDYWVIDLAPDYSCALVGTPDRRFLWILSRAPRMDENTYGKLVARAAAQGFDVARLARTPQTR